MNALREMLQDGLFLFCTVIVMGCNVKTDTSAPVSLAGMALIPGFTIGYPTLIEAAQDTYSVIVLKHGFKNIAIVGNNKGLWDTVFIDPANYSELEK